MIRRPTRRHASAARLRLLVLAFFSAPAFTFAFAFAFAIGMTAANPAVAQGAPAAPSPQSGAEAQLPSAAELEALAATIADEAKRKELLTTLQGLIEARQAAEAETPQSLSERLVAAAETSAASGKEMIDEIISEIEDIPGVARWFKSLRTNAELRGRLLRQVGIFVAILLAAWAAEAVVWWLLSGARGRLSRHGGAPITRRVPLLTAVAVLDLIPLAAFAAGGYGAFILARGQLPDGQVGQISVQFILAYVGARGLLVAVRMILAPQRPDLRLPPMADETAHYLFIWARRFVYVALFGLFLIQTLVILGMPMVGHDALVRVLGFVLLVLLVIFMLQNRAPLSRAIRGGSGASVAPVRVFFAATWHVFAIAYVIGVFVVWAWRIEDAQFDLFRATVLSAVVLAAGSLAAYVLRRLLERGLGVSDDQHLRYPRLRARANRYLPVLITAIRAIALGVAIVVILAIWGVDVLDWMSQPLGSRIMGGAASIALVVAAAVLVWELANVAIERRLEAATDDSADVARVARLRTLLPLMRKALFAVLMVMVALIVLAELGVNIGPLLAGAGIVGLAFGFGAQTLVKDIITGAFMLIEDALAVGDVVTVAGIGGLVEDMSIRSIRLRDLSGNVHTIPFSSVDTVTNMTKDFSYYLLDISVAYREDTDEVARVCCEIVEEMRGEDDFAGLILEPLEVLGVDQFADSAVILKARIKTKPIKQWLVGREFNRRLKKRFDAMGIEIPFPHRTLYFGVQKDGSAPAAHVQMEGAATVSRPAASSPASPAAEGKAKRDVKYAAVDLPDPHPDAGPRGGNGEDGDGDDTGSEAR